MNDSVFADGTRSAGTRRGMIAPRADEPTANTADWTATRTRIRPTLPTSSSDCASSASVTAHVPSEVTRYSLRRSTASAIAPPYSPKTDDRDQPGQADEADVQRRAGERVDLHRHGDLGEHRAEERGALADQQPAVRRDRQRPGVDRVPAEQPGQGAGLLGCLGGVGASLTASWDRASSSSRSCSVPDPPSGLTGRRVTARAVRPPRSRRRGGIAPGRAAGRPGPARTRRWSGAIR